MDTANSKKSVIESITVKCAMILEHAKQQNLAKNIIPKTGRNKTQKRGAGLEVNVPITTEQTKIQVNPVSARLK